MKIKPVLDALEDRDQRTTFVHTGQHYERSMSAVFLDELGLRSPDIFLGAGSGSHAEQTAAIMLRFEEFMLRAEPDVVVVVGDVNSTLACALVTAKSPSRLAHVESGLRSGDLSMPEEVNRIVVDRLSDHLLAPSADAVDNLRSEGLSDDRICLAGNVMVDTLLANLSRALEAGILKKLDLTPGGYVLVTMHRPSNVDDSEVVGLWIRALEEITSLLPVVFPVHPRTAQRLTDIQGSAVQFIAPLGYLDFVALEAQAALVVTDSGGVQEETTVLGVPCLTVRDTTERPITVSEGTNRVVGTDPSTLLPAVKEVLEAPPRARKPSLWDGHAAHRIADFLLREEMGNGQL